VLSDVEFDMYALLREVNQVTGVTSSTKQQLALSSHIEIEDLQARLRMREESTDQISSRDNRIGALQVEIAVHMEALATIRRDVNRVGGRNVVELDEVEHTPEPIAQQGLPFSLTREILTVGRTSDNDIVIPSRLFSRRHALTSRTDGRHRREHRQHKRLLRKWRTCPAAPPARW
jgi:hypothetical protein